MYYVEKIFLGCIFWAFPFRSGYSGVPPSPFFHVAGSSLTRNVPERGGHAAFPCQPFAGTLAHGTGPADGADYLHPIPRLHSVPLWHKAAQVWLAAYWLLLLVPRI